MEKPSNSWHFIGVLLWFFIALYVTITVFWALVQGFSPDWEIAIRIINGFLMFAILFFLGWRLSQHKGFKGIGGLVKIIGALQLTLTLYLYLIK